MGKGKPFIYYKYPDLIQSIRSTLLGLRAASLPVNASIARNIIIGYISAKYPILLETIHEDSTPLFSI